MDKKFITCYTHSIWF